MAAYKVINGNRYMNYTHTSYKKDANRVAGRLKRQYKSVRIIKRMIKNYGKRYDIFVYGVK
jgi:hypothetical protein